MFPEAFVKSLIVQLGKYICKKEFFGGKSLFPKIKKSQLIQIPIAIASRYSQVQIINIVNEIMDLRNKNSNADVEWLEEKINRLVYNQNGLTDEEIQMVESGN